MLLLDTSSAGRGGSLHGPASSAPACSRVPTAALSQAAWRRGFFGEERCLSTAQAQAQAQAQAGRRLAGAGGAEASLRQQQAPEVPGKPLQRSCHTALRMAVPSKGRMAEDTLQLLRDCQLDVYKPNPRQYIATISQLPGLEVWFQRASDVVRKLLYGDVDLGIVGADMLAELGRGDPDLLVLHDALAFGRCHLALAVPTSGKWANISSLDELRSMPEWTADNPLRVVTGYHAVAAAFFERARLPHVALLSADGALEAAPLMGCADIILDLVSTGVTLRENNLKEIEGGRIMDSEGVLVANRTALLSKPGLLELVHELIERLEAHLVANGFYSVVANMRGGSAEEVAARILSRPSLRGLQGPTISAVYTATGDGAAAQGNGAAPGVQAEQGLFATTICVPKKSLYASVRELREVGGSGVLVQPMTYIFDEEPKRWRKVLDELGLQSASGLPAAA